ncbi:MAG: response regulator transcription factor [Methylocystis sp.]|nr:response regulator transcription factor [Methylocystis sp.]
MTRSYTILIAAEAGLRASLVEQLALYPEFTLLETDTQAKALALLGAQSPDLFLFDAGHGAGEAQVTIERVRSSGFRGPIVLLAGKQLDLPARVDACLVRPFRFADLLARLRDVLRRRTEGDDETFRIGRYAFRADANDLVDAAGKRLRLTEKERAILLRLAKAGGASVSRDMLLRDVWGYNPAVTTRTLETHIYRLRRKLELDASTARLLVTERGGYKLASRGDLRPSRGRTSF